MILYEPKEFFFFEILSKSLKFHDNTNKLIYKLFNGPYGSLWGAEWVSQYGAIWSPIDERYKNHVMLFMVLQFFIFHTQAQKKSENYTLPHQLPLN